MDIQNPFSELARDFVGGIDEVDGDMKRMDNRNGASNRTWWKRK
jgi:hypothetical protein